MYCMRLQSRAYLAPLAEYPQSDCTSRTSPSTLTVLNRFAVILAILRLLIGESTTLPQNQITTVHAVSDLKE